MLLPEAAAGPELEVWLNLIVDAEIYPSEATGYTGVDLICHYKVGPR